MQIVQYMDSTGVCVRNERFNLIPEKKEIKVDDNVDVIHMRISM